MSAYKKFPPFGRILFELRRTGKVPSRMVMVTFDWKLARSYPRIVLPHNIPPEALQFNYLAGLPVQIVYHTNQSNRIDAVVEEILAVNPSFLATFALDLANDGMAWTLIVPLAK